jgi:hypothetical protein
MQVEAIKKHRYPTSTPREIGETYEARKEDVKVLVAVGFIAQPKRKKKYKTRMMQAEQN